MRYFFQFLRHFLLAVQFFTRLPVTGRLAAWVGYSPDMLRASAAHFPGVGALVGAAAALTYAAAALALPASAFTPLLAAIVCTAATALLTGAFHEDGLADLADGLGGSLERERALTIMKDSRIGTFGALALVLALLAKVALLALLGSLSLSLVLCALLAGHVLSRWLPLLLAWRLPHVAAAGESASKSKPVADQLGRRTVCIAFIWCLVPLALMGLAQGTIFLVASLLASGIALAYVWRLLARRLQGFTGDGLGAAQQLCEIAFYFGTALAWRSAGAA